MKTDKELGLKVKDHLIKIGIETPLKDNELSVKELDEKKSIIKKSMEDIMKVLALDLEDDSLKETPSRIAKMYLEEIFIGLDYENFPKATTVDNKMHYNEMVTENNVTISSTCEHHFVSIDGVAHISYIPKNKVLGLSKLNRIANFFARRPQIQERLTVQIGETLKYILDTDDVAVVVDAVHFCVKSRGIKDQNSSTVTSFLSGNYRTNPETRQEFMAIVNKTKK